MGFVAAIPRTYNVWDESYQTFEFGSSQDDETVIISNTIFKERSHPGLQALGPKLKYQASRTSSYAVKMTIV